MKKVFENMLNQPVSVDLIENPISVSAKQRFTIEGGNLNSAELRRLVNQGIFRLIQTIDDVVDIVEAVEDIKQPEEEKKIPVVEDEEINSDLLTSVDKVVELNSDAVDDGIYAHDYRKSETGVDYAERKDHKKKKRARE